MIRPARVCLAALLVAGVARGAGEVAPGAYCPLPKKGEKARCLEPARAQYGAFFEALEEGEVPDDEAEGIEAAVRAGRGSDEAYLALSSLAYGYWQLSKTAVAQEQRDPRLVERLERWNALLGMAYDEAADDEEWQRALVVAAEDLQHRAPPVELRCVDERGETIPCESTDAIMRGLDATAGEVGLRGALERLLRRMFGSEAS